MHILIKIENKNVEILTAYEDIPDAVILFDTEGLENLPVKQVRKLADDQELRISNFERYEIRELHIKKKSVQEVMEQPNLEPSYQCRSCDNYLYNHVSPGKCPSCNSTRVVDIRHRGE